MASLKELKGRIASVKSTQKITKAKQMVAAAKLRKAQAAAEAGRPYAQRLEKVVASLAGKVTGDSAPRLLAGTGKDDVHLLVVANGDKGLAGAFNANIVKAAVAKARVLIAQGKTVKFYLIGRKGRAVIARTFPGLIAGQFDTTDVRTPGFDEAQAVAQDISERFFAGEFDVAHLFYAAFRSPLVQIPTEQQIIPVAVPADAPASSGAAVEYEPDEEAILADLLPRNITIQIFKALLENMASEQGASMTAMDNATRNAGDLINRLTIEYNRSRQAAITTELVEIISGAEAL
ncbi:MULTISPECIES: F0F1 ATP synthase subunit gamma [unclassified Sphingobium]|uniref:F0F1 ATP synthase subunit gamma n=1 Tax=unclassified Sphingobium TaxID=2611147 RepID=UPI0022257A5E|nr:MULTISPECIES: F0F1 ATP synthase subunit gamma [unclassified Sphingobium]MCW2367917.1 F-type H+-transporting ATPase subunit gamma [Sphingobium sp. B11D3D]MCW2410418.1 F-type H+-transporting ATPase subunit gamma [Sphingobium sp. B8D3D]MCW2413889.1 F-type H+-transporting ATPase subunit gamma [Sphingobium sp. B8D3A]